MSAAIKCPHCGRAYSRYEGAWRGWSVDLTTNRVSGPGGFSVKLEGQEAVILSVLIAAHGEVVAHERMHWAIWGMDVPDLPDTTLRTRLTSLRRKLGRGGLVVRSEKRIGYAADVAESRQERAA